LQHIIVAAYSDYQTESTDLKIPDVVAAPRLPVSGPGVTQWLDALAEKLQPAAHLAGPDDLCVMPYTSGTTGKPKGCIHTHRTVMSTTVAGGAWVDMQPDSVFDAAVSRDRHAMQHEPADLLRLHDRPDDALGSRCGG
jgi:fatty-acyl-CoA synthase